MANRTDNQRKIIWAIARIKQHILDIQKVLDSVDADECDFLIDSGMYPFTANLDETAFAFQDWIDDLQAKWSEPQDHPLDPIEGGEYDDGTMKEYFDKGRNNG